MFPKSRCTLRHWEIQNHLGTRWPLTVRNGVPQLLTHRAIYSDPITPFITFVGSHLVPIASTFRKVPISHTGGAVELLQPFLKIIFLNMDFMVFLKISG